VKRIALLLLLISTPAFADSTDISIEQILNRVWDGDDSLQVSGAGGASIGGDLTGGTTGSILFVGPGPILSEDNSGLFWDDTLNRVGINTASPGNVLDVKTTSGTMARFQSTSNNEGFAILGSSDTTTLSAVTGDGLQLRADNDSTDALTIAAGGAITITDTFVSSFTSSIGWSAQRADNQACNTTCTSACVAGTNSGDSAFLSCSDATADACLCAGSS
jgi:hypothetical protein